MNTKTRLYGILAVLLVVSMCIGSAAAARTIETGGDAFVYEQIQMSDPNFGDTLYKMSGDATPVLLNTIPASNGVFDLLEAAVGTYAGVYYNRSTDLSGASRVNIWYPEMTLGAYLAGATDSIDGRTILKETEIRFIIESPKVGPATSASEGGWNPVVSVNFTTPDGGKTTSIGINATDDIADFSQLYFDGSVEITSETFKMGSNAVAGTYVALAEFSESDFPGIPDKYRKSNAISFTVQSDTLTLTANEDSVARSNSFTVTIHGEPKKRYLIFIEGSDEHQPVLVAGQNGMLTSVDPTSPDDGWTDLSINTNMVPGSAYPYSYAVFKTNDFGERTVQYNTLASTEDKTYTIKAYEAERKADAINYSRVEGGEYASEEVTIEEGAVTIFVSGDRPYYIGEEVKLTGTNTDSSDIFLFITGQGLRENGVTLSTRDPADTARTPDASVNTDSTWEYIWDTSYLGLDIGEYTIYATSQLTNGKSSEAGIHGGKLSDSEYATVLISFEPPGASINPSSFFVEKGSSLSVSGMTSGNPDSLKYYVFGPNRYLSGTAPVIPDGTYEISIPTDDSWIADQYYLIIVHPMYNKQFDVSEEINGDHPFLVVQQNGWTTASFPVEGPNRLQGSNAAHALCMMMDSANIDDAYGQYTFIVTEDAPVIIQSEDPGSGPTFRHSILSKSFTPSENLKTGETGTSEISLEISPALVPSDDLYIYSDLTTSSWSATISRGNSIILTVPSDAPYIDGWMLFTSNWGDTMLTIHLEGTVPNKISKKISLLKLVEYEHDGENVVGRYVSPKQLVVAVDGTEISDTLSLIPGWNFISVPKTLASGTDIASKLFASVDTGDNQILLYNTSTAAWDPVKADDSISPLSAYWIYAKDPATLLLHYPDKPTVPAVKTLYPGWNAVGLSAAAQTKAGNALAGTSWRTLIPWTEGSYETAIINGGTDENSPDRYMTPGNGYWLYVTSEGTLTGHTA